MPDLVALVAAFAVAAALSPLAIAVLRRHGYRQRVRDDGPQSHLNKQGTPTMGGIVIIVAFVAAVAVSQPLVGAVGGAVTLVIGLTVGFGLVGLADDWAIIKHQRSLGLRAREKLALQFVLAAGFLYLLRRLGFVNLVVLVPFGDALLRLGWWYYPAAAVFIVLTSNSINLTDGLDGLAAGLAAIAGVSLGALAIARGEPAMSAAVFALAGACVGFLWYNAHPARVFMGDTGALALGAALAGAAIAVKAELLLLIIGVIFYLEALSVIVQVAAFRLTAKRVLRMSPLHHHLELSGWPEPRIVARMWIAGALVGWGAVVVERLRPW
jgi:phospho-N-acetylmuramoyl-pentapeptide-transferase